MPDRPGPGSPNIPTPRWVRLIRVTTAAYLALGVAALAAWRLTGRVAWVEYFFRYPGAVLLVSLPAVALCFSLRVVGEFARGEPLRLAWRLIALAAACDLFSAFCVHLLRAAAVRNLFDQLVMQSGGPQAALQQIGVLAGGSLRFAVLAVALWIVLRAYRESGLQARLTAFDWALLAGMAVYVSLEARETATAMRAGLRPDVKVILGWPTDPLLWALLAEALILYRSARQMRPGLIGRCWQAMGLGVLLVAIGDFLLWAARSNYLPWPWSALEWYIWLPAAAAFAAAPVYQLAAVQAARSSRRPR